ncbi:hypothetical protein TNCV_1876181 [Trichonephila clavipes]|nr:hypothetical protein TNCV_1876181 [Trichonephila clavipes]
MTYFTPDEILGMINRDDSDSSSLSDEDDYQSDNGSDTGDDDEDQDVTLVFSATTQYGIHTDKFNSVLFDFQEVELQSYCKKITKITWGGHRSSGRYQEMDSTIHSTYDRLYHVECLARI